MSKDKRSRPGPQRGNAVRRRKPHFFIFLLVQQQDFAICHRIVYVRGRVPSVADSHSLPLVVVLHFINLAKSTSASGAPRRTSARRRTTRGRGQGQLHNVGLRSDSGVSLELQVCGGGFDLSPGDADKR